MAPARHPRVQELLGDLAASAPGIDAVIQPWHGVDAARRALVDGSTDIAVSVFPAAQDDLGRQPVSEETYAVVMREDHPAAEGFDLDRWLTFPPASSAPRPVWPSSSRRSPWKGSRCLSPGHRRRERDPALRHVADRLAALLH